MTCVDEMAALRAAEDKLSAAKSAYPEALGLAAVAAAAMSSTCVPAAVQLGLNIPADIACAIALAALALAEAHLQSTAEELGTAEGEYSIAFGAWSGCIKSCPKWAWEEI